MFYLKSNEYNASFQQSNVQMQQSIPTADDVLLRKSQLCNVNTPRVILRTSSECNGIVVLNTLQRPETIPNTFSDIRLARENL